MTRPRDARTKERPVVFASGGHPLLGVLHCPDAALDTGLIMIPAGAQYRVGPHRQHVLIARALAERGIPVFRYDSSGIADSAGPYLDFELAPDIDAAVNTLLESVPGLERVVLWGICGSASSILIHGELAPQVRGLILLNPWVRSEQSRARTFLKHYYLRRLINVDFWRKLSSGGFDFKSSMSSLVEAVRSAVWPGSAAAASAPENGAPKETASRPMVERMADGLDSFHGPVLLVMSGNDLTAREFDEVTSASERWRRLLGRPGIRRCDLEAADHTFSQPAWHEQLTRWMGDWIVELDSDAVAPSRHDEILSR